VILQQALFEAKNRKDQRKKRGASVSLKKDLGKERVPLEKYGNVYQSYHVVIEAESLWNTSLIR
jgi:hypothetical protein